jgi:hypothetical protein
MISQTIFEFEFSKVGQKINYEDNLNFEFS